MTGLIRNTARLRYMRQEALRVAGWTPELRDLIKLHKLNIGTCIACAGWLNVALVKFLHAEDGDNSFHFDPDGVPAVIMEAILFNSDREPFAADLVAWPLHEPHNFATAMGLNDGADVLGAQNAVARQGQPLKIHRTPLDWLRAGGEGCVLLKPGARHWLRKAGGPFLCEDVAHGIEVRDFLDNDPRYRILIPSDTLKSRRAA